MITPAVSTGEVLAVVGALVAGVHGSWWSAVAVLVSFAVVATRRAAGHRGGRRRRVVALVATCVVCALFGTLLGRRAWADSAPGELGAYTGLATVVTDPVPSGGGWRVTLRVRDQRFDAWVFGGKARRVARLAVGQRVWTEAVRRPFSDASSGNARRSRQRHVVGRLDVVTLGDVVDGNPLARTAARLRALLRDQAARSMASADAALFTGLVLGDDAAQPAAMVEQFRAAGLSHLTAVSGQNISLLLGLLAPLVRRLRPIARLAATLAAIAWLAFVTRLEPSVLRAGLMAGWTAVATARGRPTPPLRILALAVAVLVLVDPLLVWSVGMWLSAGATAGVTVVAPRLVPLLGGPAWLRMPLAVTLGAQAGVALPSLLVFHRLALLSPVANLLAVPVAAVVMTLGVPCAVAAALVPVARPVLMALPVGGTRWVRHVAELFAVLDPGRVITVAGWTVIVALLVVRQARSGRAEPSRSPAPTVVAAGVCQGGRRGDASDQW